MLLNQLTISYKCHSSIGNSLDLKTMIDELLYTFMDQTESIYGVFYLKTSELEEKISSFGKKVDLDLNALNIDSSKIVIEKYSEKLNLLLFQVEYGVFLFLYSSNESLDFIKAMYESLRKKIDISINACLNVKELERKNIELYNLNQGLKEKIKKAVEENQKKDRLMFEQTKMTQIGELMGNIAHQWRQPLSIISTLASGMKVKKEIDSLSDEEFYNYTNKIVGNVTLLSTTISEFSDYIKENNQLKDVVIQERVRTALKIVEESFENYEIELIEEQMETEDIHFKLISGELLQSLIPILNNAKDVLCKKTYPKWIRYSVKKDKNLIYIIIEDNGGGIDMEIIDRIFEPYFTTKHQSQGTGIGLYNSYNIITKQLYGKLYVQNTKSGARFTIELPQNLDYSI